VAKQVQKLDMPDDKYERIMGKPRLQQAKLLMREKALQMQENDENKLKDGTVFSNDPMDRMETNN